MKIIIVICLLIVIVLLAKDKIIFKKVVKDMPQHPKVNPDLPAIMGQPKPIQRQPAPIIVPERQNKEMDGMPDNFETETEGKSIAREIPQEELDEVFRDEPDLDFDDEEEEWKDRGLPNSDNDFATGVTFNELSTVGALLQQGIQEPASQHAANILQHIQGTELFSLLENSIEGASRKIAALLDKSLTKDTDFSTSDLRKGNLDGFDIGEFV